MSRYVVHLTTWANTAIEVEADDPDQARRRAESWLFARRSVGDHESLVHLTEERSYG